MEPILFDKEITDSKHKLVFLFHRLSDVESGFIYGVSIDGSDFNLTCGEALEFGRTIKRHTILKPRISDKHFNESGKIFIYFSDDKESMAGLNYIKGLLNQLGWKENKAHMVK